MLADASQAQVVLIGAFEFDLRTGELSRAGVRIKFQPQPAKVLALLVTRAGELVTRAELQQQVWGSETFVDFETRLNSCIKDIRQALGDDPDAPRYIETIPRRGYRLIYPVEGKRRASSRPQVWWGEHRAAALLLGTLAAVVALLAANLGGLRDRLLGTPQAELIQAIAVLPLENLSGNPEQDHFVDGMTDALIAELGKVSALRVVSRTSTMQYKSRNKALPEIAQELNVDAVVEGSVVREGERVRITAQLLRADPEQQLWAESYERDLRDVLALQAEVARAIVQEIKVKLTPQEQARLAQSRPVNPRAYEAYLKGRYIWNRRTPEAMQKGIDYFQQALEEDPNYALAYTGLSDSYYFLGSYHIVQPKEAYRKAQAAAQRALKIDDSLAEAHASLAAIKHVYEWDWSGAEKEFQRAIELNPSYGTAHQWYAEYLSHMGRHEQAAAEIRRAQEVDPLSLATSVAGDILLYLARHYDQAIDQLRETLAMDPNFPPARLFLGLVYVEKGMYEEAIAEFEKGRVLSRANPEMLAYLGRVYALQGRRSEAQQVLDELGEISKEKYVSPYALAQIFVALGDKRRAFIWLERAYEDRSIAMTLLKVAPPLDPLRSDPRFQDLLRRMNFPE